jgi:hypothetical protein
MSTRQARIRANLRAAELTVSVRRTESAIHMELVRLSTDPRPVWGAR